MTAAFANDIFLLDPKYIFVWHSDLSSTICRSAWLQGHATNHNNYYQNMDVHHFTHYNYIDAMDFIHAAMFIWLCRWNFVIMSSFICNKTGNVHVTWQWGTFMQPLLPSKSRNYYIFWMHLLALVIQHAMHMHCIVVSLVAYLAVSYFSTVRHKGMICGKRVTEYNVCFDFLYNFCPRHFSF